MVETVEAFCGEHSVDWQTVLYEWPASTFQALYGAYVKRKVADELTQRRSMEIAAIWGNPNLDQKEHPKLRQEYQAEIDASYSKAIAGLYGQSEEQQEEEINYDDPFWQAMERGLEKRALPEPKVE